ncbi:hypothetical protein EVAR_40584_1 [Eumeta japonica]|uniref:Uncharacterized protein n=1 Tax=Eumeta variegata TaxID=151549 RepID=A0A4C1VYX9_EUMVA|nr:hypothetical protein EVAR_40584_1 [Eumeta japonica]
MFMKGFMHLTHIDDEACSVLLHDVTDGDDVGRVSRRRGDVRSEIFPVLGCTRAGKNAYVSELSRSGDAHPRDASTCGGVTGSA